jgi:SET family sugar efflux transporter-like MFS transporter
MACVLFAWNRNYFILLFVGVFLSSFGSTANPQLFALAREHADHTGREAVMFSSVLRAQVSLAWVIGPPLAYALAMGFGFTVMYLSAVSRLWCAARWCGSSCRRCVKSRKWQQVRWKRRAVIAAMRCSCLLSAR